MNTVAFSPDDATLAAGSSARLLWLFDVTTGNSIGHLPHPAPIMSSAYRSGDALLTATENGTVRSWNLPGPIVSGPKDSVFVVSFDPSGRKLAVVPGAGDNTIAIWDVSTSQYPSPAGPTLLNTETAKFSGSGMISPKGNLLAAGDITGGVQLWNITDPAQPTKIGPTLPVAKDLIETVTVSADERLLPPAGRARRGVLPRAVPAHQGQVGTPPVHTRVLAAGRHRRATCSVRPSGSPMAGATRSPGSRSPARTASPSCWPSSPLPVADGVEGLEDLRLRDGPGAGSEGVRCRR